MSNILSNLKGKFAKQFSNSLAVQVDVGEGVVGSRQGYFPSKSRDKCSCSKQSRNEGCRIVPD